VGVARSFLMMHILKRLRNNKFKTGWNMNSSLLIIKSTKSIEITECETFTCCTQRQNSRYKSELEYRNLSADYMSDEDHKVFATTSVLQIQVLIKWSLIIIIFVFVFVFVTIFSDSFCININLKVLAQCETCATATPCR
jgi:hypothetical protein